MPQHRNAPPRIRAKAEKSERANRSRPRKPLQERGRARYEAMLDAAEALLAQQEIEDIGYYEIVKRARMPAASAYHFFPTKSAIFMALAERHFAHFIGEASRGPLRPHENWQGAVAEAHATAVTYYNSHPGAMKLILGAQPFLEVQIADFGANRTISALMLESFTAAYELPLIRDLERKFLVAVAISDGVWRASYSAFGKITKEYAEDALRAVLAYLRSFLPEQMELRPPSTAATAPP